MSAPTAAQRRADLHKRGKIPPRTRQAARQLPPRPPQAAVKPVLPARANPLSPLNPLLINDGAPTLRLAASGNPTPKAFLRSKLRLLRRYAREGLLDTPEGRRAVTQYEPFLFALVYVPHYFVLDQTSTITLSQFHVDALVYIQEWAVPSTKTRQDRDGWVAPRESGKSTMFFTLGPLWAAAHAHRYFISAFSDSDDQVQKHLAKFHENIDNNKLLQTDYPDLCTPARRPNGNPINDNKNAYVSSSKFTFEAHTVDGKIVGLVDAWGRRPDMIILDDIEPSEDKYSPAQKHKGVTRLTDKILYLNEFARVVLVGTVTMAGSIMHDIVLSILEPGDPATRNLVATWVKNQNFRAHYYPALSVDPATGELTSLWPEKWPVEELKPRLGTADFMKNMQNNPVGSGDFWESGDITYATLTKTTLTILVLDPAVTVSDRSDYTGVAVMRYQPRSKTALADRLPHSPTQHSPASAPPPPLSKRDRAIRIAVRRNRKFPPDATPQQIDQLIADILPHLPDDPTPTDQISSSTADTDREHARVEVAFANRVKMRPTRLSQYVLSILERFPEISYVLVEVNQGQEFVAEHFDGLPVPVKTINNTEPKDVRIARLASYYKHPIPWVVHADRFVPLEEECYAYPATAHDDTVDAVAGGALHFLHIPARQKAKRRNNPRVVQTPYTANYVQTSTRRAA